MSKILIIAEHDGTELNLSTAKCLSCAAAMGGDIDIAVFGQAVDAVAGQAAGLAGVNRVVAVDSEHLSAPMAANWAPVGSTASVSHTRQSPSCAAPPATGSCPRRDAP